MTGLLELIDRAIAQAGQDESYSAMVLLVRAKDAAAREADKKRAAAARVEAIKQVAVLRAQKRVARSGQRDEAALAAAAAVAAAPTRPVKCGTVSNDLKGLTLGPWKVLSLEESGGVTPKWLCRCVGCGCKRAVNGAQLRNKPPACGGCGRIAS
jgi:hypothetical protein